MEKVLIDTDVIVDFIRGHNQRIKNILQGIQDKIITPSLSIFTIVEIYAGRDVDDKQDILKEFLSNFEIIGIEVETAEAAGRIKHKHRTSLPDSIIAATAIQHKVALFTFNTKHFKLIPNISFYTIEAN